MEEARLRAEVEGASLFLEIRATKDRVSSLKSQAGKDKEAMEEDYHKALELIFAYGYGCCMFKYNICGDQLKVPNCIPDSSGPLPQEFFMDPRCPSALVATKATAAEVDQSEATKEPKRSAPAGDQSLLLSLFSFLLFLLLKFL